jgi:hypothetical protein
MDIIENIKKLITMKKSSKVKNMVLCYLVRISDKLSRDESNKLEILNRICLKQYSSNKELGELKRSIRDIIKIVEKYADPDETLSESEGSDEEVSEGPSVDLLLDDYHEYVDRSDEVYDDENYNDDLYEELRKQIIVSMRPPSVDDIEKELDMNVPKYNKFTDTHPMEGVSYDKANKSYKIKYTSNTFKNCQKAIQVVYEKMSEEFGKIFSGKLCKQNFVYKNKNFVSYWIHDNPYFDILHVIQAFGYGEKHSRNKYNSFSKFISLRIFHKNEFGGYILRELINEVSTYELILDSNNPLSKSFKKDAAKILSDLRKSNLLSITSDRIHLDFSNLINSVSISSFRTKNVVYIGYVGILDESLDEYIFKWGRATDIFQRKKAHVKLFGKFEFVFIGETDNYKIVEDLFKFDLDSFGLRRFFTIKDKDLQELFTVTDFYTIERIIDHLRKLIKDNPLPSFQNLEYEYENKLQIICSDRDYKLKEMDLRYKLSDNFRLAMERDIAYFKYMSIDDVSHKTSKNITPTKPRVKIVGKNKTVII